jgi:predicted RecB family nuclease
MKHNAGQPQELLVVPVRNSECAECPWKAYCDEDLEVGNGDISLIPGLGWNQWKVHRDTTGTVKRDQLARLDWPTADLVATRLDVASLLRAAAGMPERTPLDELESNDRRLQALEARAFMTVADLARLSASTAQYSGKPVGSLGKHIDLARAALSDDPAFRQRGIESVEVPRADIEIDVDMENTDDGAYLWGTLLTHRAGSGKHDDGYRAFVSWDNSAESFEKTFREFWTWLQDQLEEARTSGLSLRAYCYHAVAENTQMLKLAGAFENDVRAFIASEEWVDLLGVVRNQLLTGGSLGLKNIAPLADFRWASDEAGGEEAIVRYDTASGSGPEAADAQEWLHEYNRNDVEATLAIRDWLEDVELPSIGELDLVWQGE